ncbi:MAG: sigma-70 family RNA polymerase sigma factor [Planctomycetaceae bacterium]
MTTDSLFADFIHRIREGDERAAQELVSQYESLVRREVRMHLEDPRLQRVLDSMDVCQSVMASFFLRSRAGQYDLESPEQLVGLLVTMARNKVVSAARNEQRRKRDVRRIAGDSEAVNRLTDSGQSPSEIVSHDELFAKFQAGLNDEERLLSELRSDGLEWAEIARQIGGTAQARRMQLARAVDRVSRELGLEE